MKKVVAQGKFISVRSAARALEVHENTIRNWVAEGILDAEQLPGSGFNRITVESVERVLNRTKEEKGLPEGVVARIDVTLEGVRVNLRVGMPATEFAALLHTIAEAYETGTIERVE